MMSARGGGGGGTSKADAVRKPSKGGCVKKQTRGEGVKKRNPKILQTSYVHACTLTARAAPADGGDVPAPLQIRQPPRLQRRIHEGQCV